MFRMSNDMQIKKSKGIHFSQFHGQCGFYELLRMCKECCSLIWGSIGKGPLNFDGELFIFIFFRIPYTFYSFPLYLSSF
jgi:hypothetical protein